MNKTNYTNYRSKVIVHNGKMYLTGLNVTIHPNWVSIQDVLLYDDLLDTWSSIGSNNHRTQGQTVISHRNNIYIFGGQTTSAGTITDITALNITKSVNNILTAKSDGTLNAPSLSVGRMISGSMNPTFPLDVFGTRIRVDSGGSYVGGFDTNWNASGGFGETSFYNHRGLGGGAFAFRNRNADGTDEGYNLLYALSVSNPSDRRIKKNINIVDDNYALEKLRLIEPKTYNYIADNLPKETVIGFIAQEVQEFLPEAITLTPDFVPNIYKNCNVNIVSEKCISLTISNDDILSSNLSISDILRLQTDIGDVDFVISNISDNLVTGTLDKELADVSSVFVYGKKVDDFHVLNKPYLYTLNFSATQELDRILDWHTKEVDRSVSGDANSVYGQSLLTRIKNLEQEKSALETRVATLESQLQSVLSRLQAGGL